MKKICLLAGFIMVILFSRFLLLHADSAASLSFSGSYSLRATGCEANYWNPANLVYPMPYRVEVLLINSSFGLDNNAFSINRYNELNGTYLTDKDKQKLVDDLRKSLSFNTLASYNIAGVSFDNLAFSSRVNLFASAKLSSRYVELLLFGNEYDKVYRFTRKNNRVEALGYTDLTFGFSPYSFEIGGHTIHTGIAFSLLRGLGVLTTEEYHGILAVSDDGVSLDQEIILKSGVGGYGMKSLVGLRTDINEDLSLSLTVDNLGGFIYWTNETEKRYLTAKIDSVYVSRLNEDVFEHSETSEKTGNFTTTLPVNTRLSVLYRLEDINFSLDWKQGFANSVVTNKTPEISMGTEYFATPRIPLRMGFEPGLGSDLYSFSYGLGFVANSFEINLGLKTSGSMIPGSYSKGVALALTSKLRF